MRGLEMNVRLARRVAMQCFAIALFSPTGTAAQASDSDIISGTVVKVDVERGTVTLRHGGVAHLYLPAATTTFRYFHPALVARIKNGDAVRFRADRFDGGLRLLTIVPVQPDATR